MYMYIVLIEYSLSVRITENAFAGGGTYVAYTRALVRELPATFRAAFRTNFVSATPEKFFSRRINRRAESVNAQTDKAGCRNMLIPKGVLPEFYNELRYIIPSTWHFYTPEIFLGRL